MFVKFRQCVKETLKTKQLTYSQLGEMSGLAESTIKCFMCGANDSRRVAEKIAICLGLNLVYQNGEYIVT